MARTKRRKRCESSPGFSAPNTTSARNGESSNCLEKGSRCPIVETVSFPDIEHPSEIVRCSNSNSRGYAAFCKWTASDDDFFVLRRFGSTSARVALYLQDQIAQLEEELQYQDRLCKQAPEDHADSGTFRFDHWPRRGQILTELSSRLEHYRTDLPHKCSAQMCY